MRFSWPEDTVFQRVSLDAEQTHCACCGRVLHVCGQRRHRIYTLKHPVELCCRLAHCSDPACPTRPATLSPAADLSLTLPVWLLGWDVFCFIGHRRFARHWSVPQIHDELLDSYRIKLSVAAICVYIRRYQVMVAARQQDFSLLRLAYRDIRSVVLSIDGLQPEKGHETLYAVRELKALLRAARRAAGHPSSRPRPRERSPACPPPGGGDPRRRPQQRPTGCRSPGAGRVAQPPLTGTARGRPDSMSRPRPGVLLATFGPRAGRSASIGGGSGV